MIDKSIRQYYESGQLVKSGRGRPGYQGEKDYDTTTSLEKTPELHQKMNDAATEAQNEYVAKIQSGEIPFPDNLDFEMSKIGDKARHDIMKSQSDQPEIFSETLQEGLDKSNIQQKQKRSREQELLDEMNQTRLSDEDWLEEADARQLTASLPYMKDFSYDAGESTVHPGDIAHGPGGRFESTAQRLKTEIEKAGGVDYTDAMMRNVVTQNPEVKGLIAKSLNLAKGLTKDYATKTGDITLKSAATGAGKKFITNAIAKKIAGTGILTALGPIGWLVGGWLARKAVSKFTGVEDKGLGVMDAFTKNLNVFKKQGLGAQEAFESASEIKSLEKRRDWMLNRKEQGKGYSDKNLGDVTRTLAKKKGLDILNPNEMKNIDKDLGIITKIKPVFDYEAEAYDIKPILKGEEEPSWEGDGTDIPSPTRVEETAAMEDINIVPPPAPAPAPVHHPHVGGNGGGDQAAADRAGGAGLSSPFKVGGLIRVPVTNIDKPLTGRSRDI